MVLHHSNSINKSEKSEKLTFKIFSEINPK